MKTNLFLITSASLLVVLCLVPLYSHHGTSFLTKTMEGNVAEVKIAELAATKAQNERVKEYGQMLVKDHSMALDRMQMLMNERMARNTYTNKSGRNWHEMKLDATNQKTYDRMSKMSGAAFDREFIDMMVTKHRNGIREFETHVRSHPAATGTDYARDTDTIAFANEMLPTLRMHLQKGMEIQKEMKGGTPISSR